MKSEGTVGQTTTPTRFTENDDFDAFGRPRTVTAPDGTETTYQYGGDRVKRRTVTIGGVSSQTRLRYDSFGGLSSVSELADPSKSASYDSASSVTAWGGWEYRWDPFAMMMNQAPTPRARPSPSTSTTPRRRGLRSLPERRGDEVHRAREG